MDYRFKPIINAKYPEDNKSPDWVIYSLGDYCNPKIIMTDLDAKDFVSEFCSYHGIKIDFGQ